MVTAFPMNSTNAPTRLRLTMNMAARIATATDFMIRLTLAPANPHRTAKMDVFP
jgi:hypothetical protein